ncbi:hypothetical protein K6112_00180 [Methylophilales bacterium]|nr:hypothetical protein K6112_00180 [Methylophilales bacterium]
MNKPTKNYDLIKSSRKKLVYFYGAFITLLALVYIIFLRVPFLSEQLGWDELQFMSWGKSLIEHGPFSLDITFRLFTVFYHSMLYYFSGMDTIIFRFIVTSILIVNTFFIFLICYRTYSLLSGITGSLTFFSYMGLGAFQGNNFTQELLSNFWMSCAVIAAIYRKSFFSTFILGVIVGAGFLARPLFLLFVAVIFIWQFIILSYPDYVIRLKHASIYVLGFFIPILAEFAITSYYSGSFETYIDQWLNLVSYGTGASALTYFNNLQSLINTQKSLLLPLVTIALIGLYRIRLSSKKYSLFFLLWLVACLVNISITGQFFLHYSQVLILPLAILSGVALGDFISFLYVKNKYLPTFLVTLILLGFTYLGHPHIRYYMPYLEKKITSREFWWRTGTPDWSVAMEAPQYLKKQMKKDDEYFAWTGVPIFYTYLGPSVLPSVIYDVEMMAKQYSYMSWKRFPSFDYKLNQKKLIAKIKSETPPKWITIQNRSGRLLKMIDGFPEFFYLVSSKYNLDVSFDHDLVYKIKPKNELINSFLDEIPISILVRNYMINSFDFYPEKVSISANNLNSLSENKTVTYSGNFSNLLGNNKHLKISLEELSTNKKYRDSLKSELGLSINNANYDFRKATTKEQIDIASTSLSEALLLTTDFYKGVERIFIQTDNIMYEGPGLLGRLPPIYQDIKKPEIFLFGRDVDFLNTKKIISIYIIGKDNAKVYFNNISIKK